MSTLDNGVTEVWKNETKYAIVHAIDDFLTLDKKLNILELSRKLRCFDFYVQNDEVLEESQKIIERYLSNIAITLAAKLEENTSVQSSIDFVIDAWLAIYSKMIFIERILSTPIGEFANVRSLGANITSNTFDNCNINIKLKVALYTYISDIRSEFQEELLQSVQNKTKLAGKVERLRKGAFVMRIISRESSGEELKELALDSYLAYFKKFNFGSNTAKIRYLQKIEDFIMFERKLIEVSAAKEHQDELIKFLYATAFTDKLRQLVEILGWEWHTQSERSFLNILYKLTNHVLVDKINFLATAFTLHVTDCFQKVYDSSKKEILFENLIKQRSSFKLIVSRYFEDNELLVSALKDGVKKFVKKNINIVIDLKNGLESNDDFIDVLLDFVHSYLLTRNVSTITEIDFLREVKLWSGMIDDKDVFQIKYRKLLSKRLIFRRHHQYGDKHNIKLEGMLKDIFNKPYAKKIETMLNDFDTSNGYGSTFQDGIFDPVVLTTGSWPISLDKEAVNANKCILPDYLQNKLIEFRDLFITKPKNSKKKLEWVHALSQMELERDYQGVEKILVVSLFQAIILFALETGTKKTHTIEELVTVCGISKDILQQELQQLLEYMEDGIKAKGLVLAVPNEGFAVNEEFASKRNRVIFARYSLFEKKKVISPETKQRILKDRLSIIDAKLVRLVKRSGEDVEEKVIQNCIEGLVFSTTEEIVKERIESLISREYIERSGNSLMYFA